MLQCTERLPLNPSHSGGAVSSSSSEAERLVRRAVDVLESEAPTHARMFATTLHDLIVVVDLGNDAVTISARGETILVAEAKREHAQVRVKTTLATGLALVRGDASIIDAIHTGELDAYGEVTRLERASRAMEVFVHGMVRCPSGSTVVEELQRTIEKENEEST